MIEVTCDHLFNVVLTNVTGKTLGWEFSLVTASSLATQSALIPVMSNITVLLKTIYYGKFRPMKSLLFKFCNMVEVTIQRDNHSASVSWDSFSPTS